MTEVVVFVSICMLQFLVLALLFCVACQHNAFVLGDKSNGAVSHSAFGVRLRKIYTNFFFLGYKNTPTTTVSSGYHLNGFGELLTVSPVPHTEEWAVGKGF